MVIVLQAVTLTYGSPFLGGTWTVGLRVHRWCPIGTPTAVPVRIHNKDAFYIPVKFE